MVALYSTVSTNTEFNMESNDFDYDYFINLVPLKQVTSKKYAYIKVPKGHYFYQLDLKTILLMT